MVPNFKSETVWIGDNLPVLRGMNSQCVDLIYLDPPFNSNKDYAAPIGSKAAGAAFKDSWNLSDVDVHEHGVLADRNPAVYSVIEAAHQSHGKSMMAYCLMMALRLLEMHRVLKLTGSIYLHCDPFASHYLKMLMDSLFNKDNFRNEVVWHYGKMSNTKLNFPRNHDILLRYSKSDNYQFTPIKGGESEYKTRFGRYLIGNQIIYGSVKHLQDKLISSRVQRKVKELGRELSDKDVLFDFDKEFKIQSDVIYVPIIKGNSAEHTGYPTQKPLALLEKIIEASSSKNDFVLDPFCGCATSLVAADRLNRKWAGIDLSRLAVDLVDERIAADRVAYGGGQRHMGRSNRPHRPSSAN